MSGSGISWAICKSAPCSRQVTTPAPHHSGFYRPDALPAAQPTASKHWRQMVDILVDNSLFVYFASAAVAVDSSHMPASTPALWSRFSPHSNFVNGHVSTMWFVVCHWPQSQEGDRYRYDISWFMIFAVAFVIFHPFAQKPPWTDLHQIWRCHGCHRHNHLYQIFWWSVKECGFCGGSEFAISHWQRQSPLTQGWCCSAARDVLKIVFVDNSDAATFHEVLDV